MEGWLVAFAVVAYSIACMWMGYKIGPKVGAKYEELKNKVFFG